MTGNDTTLVDCEFTDGFAFSSRGHSNGDRAQVNTSSVFIEANASGTSVTIDGLGDRRAGRIRRGHVERAKQVRLFIEINRRGRARQGEINGGAEVEEYGTGISLAPSC